MKHKVREKAIFAFLDNKLSSKERARLESHFEECSECRSFYQSVKSAQNTLKTLDSVPLPPVDWNRLEAKLEAEIAPPEVQRKWNGLMIWGALAGATTAAFLLTWALLYTPEQPSTPQVVVVDDVTAPNIEENSQEAEPRSIEAYVTFVSGRANISTPGSSWRSLDLDSPLERGTQLRTTDGGSMGIQFGKAHACRINPDTSVQFAKLGNPSVRLDVDDGQLSCQTTETTSPPLVLSVLDLVASASGDSRFSLRRETEVVVIELEAGSLSVGEEQGDPVELATPGRITLSRDEEGNIQVRHEPVTVAVNAPDTVDRRPIASLQIPEIDSIDSVRVNGVE